METIKSRIIQGDCLNIMKKIADKSIDFICSDFPYNISNKGNISMKNGKFSKADFGKWDKKWKNEDDYFDFVFQVCKEYKRILKNNASLVLFLDTFTGGHIAHELDKKNIFTFKAPLILEKENPAPHLKKNGFRSCFEWACWLINNKETGSFKPKVFNFQEQKNMRNVLSYLIGGEYKKTAHPTEKPEHLIKQFVEIFTNEGDIVLDSFAGGGTTAKACQLSKRHYIAIEKEPRFFQMMRERLGA